MNHHQDRTLIILKIKKIRFDDNGMRHRLNGPAVIWSDGSEEWYVHGRRHRLGGPALVRQDGWQEWYKDDLLHREDGPAVIRPDGIRHGTSTGYGIVLVVRLSSTPTVERSGG